MIRYAITDRQQTPDLLATIRNNLADGVDWIQIREKDMPTRELAALVRAALALPNPRATRILVNTRADIAIACHAHGAHLTSDSPPPSEFRRIAPPGFLIGVSCHTESELIRAESEGADFAVYGPVFPPRSKAPTTPPIGLAGLAAGCQSVIMPVLALGGITTENAASCIEAGAAGIAAITLFQRG